MSNEEIALKIIEISANTNNNYMSPMEIYNKYIDIKRILNKGE